MHYHKDHLSLNFTCVNPSGQRGIDSWLVSDLRTAVLVVLLSSQTQWWACGGWKTTSLVIQSLTDSFLHTLNFYNMQFIKILRFKLYRAVHFICLCGKWICSMIHRNDIYIQCILPMKEIDWKLFSCTPRPGYPQGYQNKYICDVNLFSGVFKRLDRNGLKRWDDVSGLIFLSSPYLPSYSEESKFMEIDKSNSAYAAQHEHLALIQRLSRSENVLYGANLENLSAGMMSKSCDNLSVETGNRTRDKSNLAR